ncbi:MAG: aminomethyl-transferring glycine dehydrogenase subunit GcvPA [Gammaproteobacteria bacterium]|nr:aminomethyl-transferring glycine dehydrogenase subunit GcvPA [Gammaproteobacteria bacterium]
MPFIPHTEQEAQQMLDIIGVAKLDDLFDEIPSDLRIDDLPDISQGLSELALTQHAKELAAQDKSKLNFIGAGAYEHHIPAVVWEIAGRGEFLTAYTPYQAEASQGTLQLLYEFQTMMANLMSMDVSNTSLYDGASGLAEAILMAVRANRHAKSKRILFAGTVNPNYRRVVNTIIKQQHIELIELPFDPQSGHITEQHLSAFDNEEFAAIVIPQPNFFGTLEDADTLTNWAHHKKLLVIGVVNPLAMALIKEPGQWGEQGADIVCGELQPLGIPLASGGPYAGFLCCKQAFVRQMPGRIIGRTVDLQGREGFTLTLQAREQHIRRGKATSNICTNQGLLVTAATIYMSVMGPAGLYHTAAVSHANTQQLVEKLTQIPGVAHAFIRPYFHEVVLRFNQPVSEVLAALSAEDIQGGFNLTDDFPQLGECLLVCVTEVKTAANLHMYAEKLAVILQRLQAQSKHIQQAESATC